MKSKALAFIVPAIAAALAFSCTTRSSFVPPGSYSNVVLVTESGQPGGANNAIIRVLQHTLDYYSKNETQFKLRMVSAHDFRDEPPTKNMVIYGVVREGRIGSIIESFIGTNSVRKVLQGQNQIFKKIDYPVKGQLTVIVTASSRDRLARVTRESGELIRDIIEDANRERLRGSLYTTEKEQAAAELKARYGFSIRIPGEYAVNQDRGDVPGVEILRDYPVRGITISWLSWPKRELTPADSLALYDFRSEIVWELHDREVMRPGLVSYGMDEFGPYSAVRMDGYWESSEDLYGGPFVCFFVHDRVRGRIWMVDCLVYAPGFDKHILLREAIAVAETFRVN